MKETKEIIKELSNKYDLQSEDTYVSLYLNKSKDTKFLNRRFKECKVVLKDKLLKNFIKTMDEIDNVLKKQIFDSVVIFASNKNRYLRFMSIPVEVDNLLIVDSSPYLRPLLLILDEWESFTILLINTNLAKIYNVILGQIDKSKKLSVNIMNKHRKGGCSQARFNRIRTGAIKKFINDVIQEIYKHSSDRMILAGPGTTKNQLFDMLPKKLKENVIEILDVDIDDDKNLLNKSINLISDNEKIESKKALEYLKSEILRDGLAVYGINDTLNAVKNGMIELLLVEKNFKLPGWICENCQMVDIGISEFCPHCHGETSKVDVIEEIIEFAKRTDTKIEFIEQDELKILGHIGGILRYK
jgi:peptide chain release factor subunit 1